MEYWPGRRNTVTPLAKRSLDAYRCSAKFWEVVMMPCFELPPEIAGPSAWYGPEVATRTDWIHKLGKEEVAEIESAVRRLEGSSVEPAALRREAFPLPTLGPQLGRILAEVQDGQGFA